MRMTDIFPEHIRELVAKLQADGQSAWTIQYCKTSILSSIFTTALNDQVTYLHPCRGVKIPTVPATPRVIITPEQFDALYGALPGADTKLLVETAIETGLRWGELTELRVRDLSLPTRMLTVSRKFIEVNRSLPPGRQAVPRKSYRRTRSTGGSSSARRSPRSSGPTSTTVSLSLGDLLFSRQSGKTGDAALVVVPNAAEGFTEPNEGGHRYRHGTLSAYNAGRCKCAHCRRAFADYRATRRAAAADRPRPPRADPG